MSLRGVAAVVGLAERAPQRYTDDETDLDLLSAVAVDAMADAGIDRSEVDGLLVHPIRGLPSFVPASVAEFVGLRPRFAELVDLGGATGAGMVWRAAAAIGAGMCTTCLCLTGTRRRRRPASSGTSEGGPSLVARAPRSKRPTRDRSPQAEFDSPYGMVGANVGYALLATRYAHEFGLTDAQRAKVAVDQRRNANANPAPAHGGPASRQCFTSRNYSDVEPKRSLFALSPRSADSAVSADWRSRTSTIVTQPLESDCPQRAPVSLPQRPYPEVEPERSSNVLSPDLHPTQGDSSGVRRFSAEPLEQLTIGVAGLAVGSRDFTYTRHSTGLGLRRVSSRGR
jgi:hypothetical protein